MKKNATPADRVETGIEGLDYALDGGFPEARSYLIEGGPGTGKTTLALQFCVNALARGKKALLISVAQSQGELTTIAHSHGMDISGLAIVTPNLDDDDDSVSVSTQQSSLKQLIAEAEAAIDKENPDVFVFDSLLELRLLSHNAIDFRRHLIRLRQKTRDMRATALFLDHVEELKPDSFERGIAHGVIQLSAAAPSIGRIQRTLYIMKLRGATFREGLHDFRIVHGGLEVFPRVIPSERGEAELRDEKFKVSEDTLNQMLGGGLEYGTSLLIAGQSGSGKSTLATMIATSAARNDQKASLFLFEERPEVFRARSGSLGLALDEFEAKGTIDLQHFEPAETSPGEFSRQVIERVDSGARVIVIDSLTGYLQALPESENVRTHLHALIQYLTRQGCLVVLTLAQRGLLGEPPVSEFEISYLADSIIMLRQHLHKGDIRRSIAVLKKRHSEHERGMEELIIQPGSVSIGRVGADGSE